MPTILKNRVTMKNKARSAVQEELPKIAGKISTIALFGEFGPPSSPRQDHFATLVSRSSSWELELVGHLRGRMP